MPVVAGRLLSYKKKTWQEMEEIFGTFVTGSQVYVIVSSRHYHHQHILPTQCDKKISVITTLQTESYGKAVHLETY